MESLLERLVPVFQAWWTPLFIIAYFLGAILVFSGLLQFIGPYSKDRKATIIFTLFAGILLLNFPTLMDSLAYTIFNASSEQTLSYSPPNHEGSSYIKIAVWAIMCIGVVGIIRACTLLIGKHHGQPQIGRSIVYFIGGIICVNYVQFMHLLGSTFGGEVESTINFVF